jgi:hypothetical protein
MMLPDGGLVSLTALRTLAGCGAQHNAPPCLLQVLLGLVRWTGAAEVLWNRLFEPWCLARDAEVELTLTGRCQLAQEHFLPYHRQPAAAAQPGLPQVAVRTFNGSLLYEPWEVAPDQQDESSWNGGYGSVGFFLSRWCFCCCWLFSGIVIQENCCSLILAVLLPALPSLQLPAAGRPRRAAVCPRAHGSAATRCLPAWRLLPGSTGARGPAQRGTTAGAAQRAPSRAH